MKKLIYLFLIIVIVGCGGGDDSAVINNDTTAPIITLLGDANVSIAQNSNYIDAGATATDNIDGELTASIVASGSVNIGVVGSYIITFSVSDAAGNAASESRQVNVIIDEDNYKGKRMGNSWCHGRNKWRGLYRS